MTFTSGIPQSGQSLGQTKQKIQDNFTNYNNLISVNHVSPNSGGQGKHKFCEFPSQSTSPATTVGEIAIYSRTPAALAEWFLQKENQIAGAADIQLSRLDKGVHAATAGWTFLPGGLIMQWGSTGAVNGSFTTVYTAHSGIAFTTTTYLVLLTCDDPGAPATPIPSFTVNSGSYSPTQFSGTTNRAISLNYLAIGV